jgi:hypothetical protein
MGRLRALVILVLVMNQASGQDTLPKFSVTTRGNNKIIIGWFNEYPKVSQISIQRSLDSTRNFKTILTVPDPSIPQNGFVDTKASSNFMFYRLFIVLDSGKYLFTKSTRPKWDTTKQVVQTPIKPPVPNKQVQIAATLNEKDRQELKETLQGIQKDEEKPVEEVKPEKLFTIKKRDTILFTVSESNFKAFRDSLVYKTKDTLVFKNIDTILIKPFVPKEVYKPSIFVYTSKDGNISIVLPDAMVKAYSIKFFEEDNSPLFEVKQIKEASLVLDKANFLRSGWFRFELYEDGKLKEKNKFFIPKDF